MEDNVRRAYEYERVEALAHEMVRGLRRSIRNLTMLGFSIRDAAEQIRGMAEGGRPGGGEFLSSYLECLALAVRLEERSAADPAAVDPIGISDGPDGRDD